MRGRPESTSVNPTSEMRRMGKRMSHPASASADAGVTSDDLAEFDGDGDGAQDDADAPRKRRRRRRRKGGGAGNTPADSA